jgi:protein involved in polysaccharide export with SLBB domain
MRVRRAGWVFAMVAAVSGAAAQTAGGPMLSPPSLPSTLPGGGAIPSLPPAAQQEILQRLLEAGAGRPGGAPQAGGFQQAVIQPGIAPPGATIPQPTPPALPFAPPAASLPPARELPQAAPEAPLSPVEQFFAARLQASPQGPLRQFGYDSFQAQPGMPPQGSAFGAVPESYVIGRDDELVVAFRGRARQTLSARVTREGMLLLPDLSPIPVAGRSLREVREELSLRAFRELAGSEVFLSLGQLRQVSVFVGGEVGRPGMQVLSPMASLLDALTAAGGVRRTGSLRAIRIEGPQGRRTVDLYPVIAGEGTAPDLLLREGERILVPPIGGVAALGGEVARPGIYELPAGSAQAPLSAMLRYAGDALRPSGNRFLLETTDAEGRRAFREISLTTPLRRGDALLVQPGTDVQAGQLRLGGHVAQPLTRAAGGRAATLRGLLGDGRIVRPDPYGRMAVIWRVDPQSRARRFQPFDLAAVLGGRADLPLREGDEVLILAQSDVAWLASPSVQRALRGEAEPAAGISAAPPVAAQAVALGQRLPQPAPTPVPQVPELACPALTQLAVAARASAQRFAHARAAGLPDLGALPCPQIFLDVPGLLPFLLDQAVLLTGEVRLPGLYPIAENTGMDALLAVAGGITDTADLSGIELSREPAEQTTTIALTRLTVDLRSRNFAAVRLSPRDGLRIPRGFGDRDTGPVTLLGEFMRPGVYDIRRGERLSEVIARAGGLTAQAYPYGAVFTRESVRARQQEGFNRTAREMEQGLMQVAAGQAVIGGRQGTDVAGAVTAGREMANALREARAAGRMVVEANPVLLASRPELDVLLEPGDLIAMPKRPNEVTVVGAVQNPGSLQFTTGWRASEYVRAAGGNQRFADPSRAFLVLPNGTSVPAGLGAWQLGGPPVPPGSLVVVPQDPSPFEAWGFLRDVTQIASQFALSAAALSVITRTGNSR